MLDNDEKTKNPNRDKFDFNDDGPVHILTNDGKALCGADKPILGHKDSRWCSCAACKKLMVVKAENML